MIEFYITVILTTTVLIAFLILEGYSLIKKINIFSGCGLHNIHYGN